MKEAIPYHPELDAIDWRVALRRAKHAIVGHVPLILASIGVAFIVLVLYVKIFPPIYQAEAVLQGEPNDDVIRSNYYSSWNVFRKGDLKSEPELVTSGLVARTVVTELGLKFNDVHHTFLTQVGYLWTDSWLGKNYRAFKDWLFPDPAAYKATPEQIEVARTVDAFKESVSVEGVPGTAIARVIVKAPTFRVADYANKVVEVYLSERSKVFSKEADTAFKSLSEEVRRAEADLAALDLRKFDFDSKNKVVLDFEKDKLQVASWSTLQATMSELKATIASVEASLEVVQRQVKSEPREIIAGRTLQDSKVKSMLQQREFDPELRPEGVRGKIRSDVARGHGNAETARGKRAGRLKEEPDRIEGWPVAHSQSDLQRAAAEGEWPAGAACVRQGGARGQAGGTVRAREADGPDSRACEDRARADAHS